MYDTGFALSVLRGALTAALIAAIAFPVAGFFDDARLGVVMLALSVGTVISGCENIGIVDFRRDLAFRKEFDMQLWSRVGGVAVTVLIAAVWHTYWALVAGILVNRVVRLLQSYLMSPYRPHFTLRAWRAIIGFSLWTWAATLLFQARERSDSVVIGRLMGAGEVGLFSVGTELGLLPVTEIVEPLNRVLFPGFASLNATATGLRDMFLGAIGLGFLVVLPAGIGISMVADPMVRLTLGTQWLQAVPVIQIMAVSGVAAIFTTICSTLLNALGRPNISFYLLMASTVVRIVCLLVLVPTYGVVGAAMALSVATAIDVCAGLWTTLPRISVSVRDLARIVIRPVIATAAMVFVLWQAHMAWTSSLGVDAVQIGLDAATRAATGAMVFGVVAAGVWLAAGRPDGAERHVLTMLQGTWTRALRLQWR